MITLTYQDLPIATHRRARALGTVSVVDVRPDTRRTVVLQSDHLAAMAVDVSGARGRPPVGTIERQWRGWTASESERPLLLLSPQRAKPEALAQFLLESGSRLDVLVSAPTSTEAPHREVLESLADQIVDDREFANRLAADDVCVTRLAEAPEVSTDAVETLGSIARSWVPSLAGGADAVWETLVATAARAMSTPSVLLCGLQLASARGGVPLDVEPVRTLRVAGAWLGALGNDAVWARIVRQASPERAVAMSLGFLCWSPQDVADLTIGELAQLSAPEQMSPAVRALLYCRRELDRASEEAVAVCDPRRRTEINQATLRRWTQLLGSELAIPMPRTRGATGATDGIHRLGRLEIGWRDAT